MGSWFRRRATGWRRVAVVAASVVAGGLVLWVFLSLYVSRHYASPVALDTLKYIWRTRLTAADGFHAIAQVPAGTTLDTDRPGLPAIGSLVQAVLGISPYRLMFVLAPVAAVMIGLGAAALMVRATGEPWWSFPVYLLAVGASMNV